MKTSVPKLSDTFALGENLIVNADTHEINHIRNDMVYAIYKIEPKMMEVLSLLAQAEGQVVPKQQLVEQVWGAYGGGEDALTQTISKLRKALGDSAKQSRIIKTIPKKGYRLLLQPQNIDPAQQPKIEYRQNTPYQPNSNAFINFLDRLSEPRFLLAFLLVSAVVITTLGILSYLMFWMAVL